MLIYFSLSSLFSIKPNKEEHPGLLLCWLDVQKVISRYLARASIELAYYGEITLGNLVTNFVTLKCSKRILNQIFNAEVPTANSRTLANHDAPVNCDPWRFTCKREFARQVLDARRLR